MAAARTGHRCGLDQRHDARHHPRGTCTPRTTSKAARSVRGLKKTVAKYTPERVEEITGIPAKHIIDAARMYAGAERGSIVYCMGITQHTTGTDNVKSLANLAMLCGHVGIPGGGVNPLRGQNNVQGACDMGGCRMCTAAIRK
jgi:formate dehydrogenase major subunit